MLNLLLFDTPGYYIQEQARISTAKMGYTARINPQLLPNLPTLTLTFILPCSAMRLLFYQSVSGTPIPAISFPASATEFLPSRLSSPRLLGGSFRTFTANLPAGILIFSHELAEICLDNMPMERIAPLFIIILKFETQYSSHL